MAMPWSVPRVTLVVFRVARNVLLRIHCLYRKMRDQAHTILTIHLGLGWLWDPLPASHPDNPTTVVVSVVSRTNCPQVVRETKPGAGQILC